MCGLAGVLNIREPRPIDETLLRRMNGILKHRGPDESGIYVDPWIGLAHARLSIVGLESGTQPISNEDETLWIVFNGEIFNHVELRHQLEARGHRFRTDTDTEVILHAYEDHGTDCVHLFNGQFAFALWDSSTHTLVLARDRVGVRPLFFTRCGDTLVFGSEIKALFLAPGVERRLDPHALLETTTLWSTLPGRTAFAGIEELPPGHVMTVRGSRIERQRYWRTPASEPSDMWSGTIEEAAEAVEAMLIDAVRLRLRSDVEVGSYLSGGLDSSLIAAIVANGLDSHVRTFSVAFEEARFDESEHQREMVRHLGLDHTEARLGNADIASKLERVIWHTEAPLLRTGPVPLHRLSGVVADHGLKVVLTGEGADEVFGGYDIFKEAKVRRFWGKAPDSRWRHLLLERLYPYVFADRDRSRGPLRAFFARSLSDPEDPVFSHRVRWSNGARNGALLHEDLRSSLAGYDPVEEIARALPADFGRRTHLAQAQTLEMESFLPGYLLSSQGDRVAMAHSVEGRFPFLDHRLIELAARIPDRWKIRGLDEKHILKRVAARHLPEAIARRRKQPYRAPIGEAFGGVDGLAGPLDHLLTPGAIARSGIFDPAKVSHLRRRLREGHVLGEVQNMAAMLVLSVQTLHEHFVSGFPRIVEAREPDRVVRRLGEPNRAVAGGAP
jgi:asparagine synthase (glutamine-hydrolysing)